MAAPAIEARDVSKKFLLRHNPDPSLKARVLGVFHKRRREIHEQFWALHGVSLTVAPGEAVALVGRNGSGKSTFLKLVAGIYRPTGGHLLMPARARIGSMIELGVGFHPDLNGTENVFLNAAINGLSRAQIHDIYPAIVEYSGLEHFMDVPLKNYSSGMHMRLGFAIAANLDPDILLLDEIFAVGDEDFQRQCRATIERFSEEGRTLLFVSHSAASVRAICRRVCVLDHGRLLFDGEVERGLVEYHRVLTQAHREETAPPLTPPPPSTDADGWHERTSQWALELLEREGLEPAHRLLEITSGAPRRNEALAAAGGDAFYQHWEINEAMNETLREFDAAFAFPLISRISLNALARVLAIVRLAMPPGAILYATWIDHADPIDVSDAPPFAYPFALVAGVADALGMKATRLDGVTHPSGESVMVLERR
jgi:ABC-type polysaccharide/polyol phosphate transport system ATPase subunit